MQDTIKGSSISITENLVLISAAFSAAFSFLMGFAVRAWLVRGRLFDRPNHRSSHSNPTPRGGGIGIIFAIFLCGTVLAYFNSRGLQLLTALGAMLCVAAISFWDDCRSLSWRIRLIVQLTAAFIAVAKVLLGTRPIGIVPILELSTGIVVVVGYANSFNFMDGINGLAATQAGLTGFGTGVIALHVGIPLSHPGIQMAFLVSAASVGFLPHNFPKARMFMGDVGSVPLGFLLALMSVWLAADYSPWLIIPLATIHLNFLMDTGITLIRRWHRGAMISESHREHFYQKLVISGKNHAHITVMVFLLQSSVITGVLLSISIGVHGAQWIVVALVVSSLWILFFCFCELNYRRFIRYSS